MVFYGALLFLCVNGIRTKCEVFFSIEDNLSNNKAATQSHTHAGHNYDAKNAVDGDIATCMRTKVIGQTSYYKTLWWEVDLQEVYNIYSVNILFKNYSVDSDGNGIVFF